MNKYEVMQLLRCPTVQVHDTDVLERRERVQVVLTFSVDAVTWHVLQGDDE